MELEFPQRVVVSPPLPATEVFLLSGIAGARGLSVVPSLYLLLTCPHLLPAGDAPATVHHSAPGHLPAIHLLGGAIGTGIAVLTLTAVLLPRLGAVK